MVGTAVALVIIKLQILVAPSFLVAALTTEGALLLVVVLVAGTAGALVIIKRKALLLGRAWLSTMAPPLWSMAMVLL